MLLIIKEIFFTLLLVPTVLATPVPGMEIVVRDETIVRREGRRSYRPDLDSICRMNHYLFATERNRYCLDNENFTFECVRQHRASRPRAFDGKCDPGYFCLMTEGRTNEPAPPDYPYENRDFLCSQMDLKLQVQIAKTLPYARTALSLKPPGPEGTMMGLLELQGDIKGFHPELDWRYVATDRPGENLLGEYVVDNGHNNDPTQLYGIKFNYDHEAQFFAAVHYLNPTRLAAITLTAYLTLIPKSPLAHAENTEGEES